MQGVEKKVATYIAVMCMQDTRTLLYIAYIDLATLCLQVYSHLVMPLELSVQNEQI